MSNKYFSFSDVLGYGWRVMKQNFWFFVGLGFIWFFITYFPVFIEITLDYLALSKTAFITWKIFLNIVQIFISIILQIGLIKIALSFCDERKPTIGMLFEFWGNFWRYLGAGILYSLIALCGLILFIIPGIIWMIKFSLCFYFVIDKGLGPVQSLKASSRTTMGVKWNLLGFGIVCGLINLLGLLCLIVGTFAAYPTVLVAQALVYRQLMEQTPQLNEFEARQPDIQPNPNLL